MKNDYELRKDYDVCAICAQEQPADSFIVCEECTLKHCTVCNGDDWLKNEHNRPWYGLELCRICLFKYVKAYTLMKSEQEKKKRKNNADEETRNDEE